MEASWLRLTQSAMVGVAYLLSMLSFAMESAVNLSKCLQRIATECAVARAELFGLQAVEQAQDFFGVAADA